jgi:hypothetical protein
MRRLTLVVVLIASCGGADWRAKVPPQYLAVAEIHHASCGNCHVRVEPGERTRAQLEAALAKHHTRVKMSDADWPLLIDYLARVP